MKFKILTLVALVGGSLLNGCSIFSPVTNPAIQKFQINYSNEVTEVQCTNTGRKVLQIMPVGANAPYDTVKMFYSKSQYELTNYSYNQWVTLPQKMLAQAIEQKLLQSCIYANVINSAFMATANYRLSTQLIELKQVMKTELSTINLIALVQLIDNASNNVIKSKIFIERIDNANSPQGFVIGANHVTQKFLADLTEWLRNDNH